MRFLQRFDVRGNAAFQVVGAQKHHHLRVFDVGVIVVNADCLEGARRARNISGGATCIRVVGAQNVHETRQIILGSCIVSIYGGNASGAAGLCDALRFLGNLRDSLIPRYLFERAFIVFLHGVG